MQYITFAKGKEINISTPPPPPPLRSKIVFAIF
jgi:hypothetical protein